MSDLAERLRSVLAERPKNTYTEEGRVQAAVLIGLFERDGEPWAVFTRRTEHVTHHKGEISFPGGGRDPEDADLIATAKRETFEEIGLEPDAIDIVGELDDLPTFGTNFIITPIVAVIDPPGDYAHSEREVVAVLELPLSELVSGLRIEDWTDRGRTWPMYFYEARGQTVWGVTAYILYGFLDIAGEVLGVKR